MKEIATCRNCGFILNTKPNLKVIDGICLACINSESKKNINFQERQAWLDDFIHKNITSKEYDCLVAVSGGKDSTVIVKKLFESHGIKKALLVNVSDNFTHTKAGQENLENILNRYNCDLITVRFNPDELNKKMLFDLKSQLNPLKYLEEQIYKFPIKIAQQHNIALVFYGENGSFEYGSSEQLDIFHPNSSSVTKMIYLGAIYPYSAVSWYEEAKTVGFKDLDTFNEWQRQGQIENYSQIDSIGYHMGIWTKFVKFGYQRVSDVACRLVRDGKLTISQARNFIAERDYICDPTSKRDFCRTLDISESYFDELVDKHANANLVTKDANGQWRRRDLLELAL